MNNDEENGLECSCISAMNKNMLKAALTLEKKYIETTRDGLIKKRDTISKFEIDESYPADFKAKQIKRLNIQINDEINGINHIDNFINQISNIPICGD